MNRRGLLAGVLATPFIVRTSGVLMPISSTNINEPMTAYDFLNQSIDSLAYYSKIRQSYIELEQYDKISKTFMYSKQLTADMNTVYQAFMFKRKFPVSTPSTITLHGSVIKLSFV